MKFALCAALAAVLPVGAARAAALVEFDFGTNNGSAASVLPTTVASGLESTLLTRGSRFSPDGVYVGVTDDINHGSFNTNNGVNDVDNPNGVTTADALANGHYTQVAVTPTAGNTLSLSGLDVYTYSQNGVRTLGVYYSLDGFATAGALAGEATIDNSFTGTQDLIDLSAITALQNVADTVTFRLAIAEPVSKYEQRGFGNVAGPTVDLAIQGAVTPVPEPAAALSLAGVAAGLLLRRRRHAR
jgi:hypothetical protein